MSRPKGSKNRSTVEKEQAVQTLRDAGLSIPRIADHLGLGRQTVKDIIQSTKDVLEQSAPGVLSEWRIAATVGASKGRHEPARDWLLHAGIIKPVDAERQQGPQVLIGIASLPGLPSRGESAPAIEVSFADNALLLAKEGEA